MKAKLVTIDNQGKVVGAVGNQKGTTNTYICLKNKAEEIAKKNYTYNSSTISLRYDIVVIKFASSD